MSEAVEVRFGLELGSAWNLLTEQGRSLHDCYRRSLRQTQVAERVGFDAIFTGHYYARYPVPILQPWPLLGNLASFAGDMQLGTGILLLPLLHPMDVAEEAATVDVLSEGRFILGVGAAYGEELDHFGIEKKTRGRRVEEMIEIIRAMWRGDRFDFSGDFFELKGVEPTLLPHSQAGPEIWLAANADAAVRRAARIADTCFFSPHANLTTLGRQQDLFLEHYGAAERGPRPTWLPLMREAFVAETTAEAKRLVRPYVERQYHELYISHGQDKVMPADDDRFDLPIDELAHERFIIGDPETAVQEIMKYVERGFNYLVLQVPWCEVDDAANERAIELLGTEVFPRVRELCGARGARIAE
ncbi:LLM class flavin-dependent oxidoreductase [Streptomyces sp. NPDC004629]|uniref:LLM class flavin-dependent oxidoreductase n=1 Tax=Streptomyces sp. NPDC004629 TaxID=3364705 RepID=UPI0036A087C8